MLTARMLEKVDQRRAAMLAALCIGLSYLATGRVESPVLLLSCFGLSGVGTGVQMACLAALLSRRRNAERVYALAMVIASLLVASLTIVFTSLVSRFSLSTIFDALAIVPLIQCLLALSMPNDGAQHGVREAKESRPARRFPPVIVSMVFMQVGGMAVWAFTERVGHKLGLATSTIGTILAMTAVAAIFGAASAAGLSRLHARVPMAIAGLIGFGLANLSIVTALSLPSYAGALLIQAFALTFTLPFLTAIALEEEDGGRTAAYGNGLAMLIGAVSPYLAGWIVETQGLRVIIAYATVALLASVIPLFRRVARST